MNFLLRDRSSHGRNRLQRRIAQLCCVLGLLFAFAPVIHGLCHVGELNHRHPAGSAHHHSHGFGDRASGRSNGGHSHTDTAAKRQHNHGHDSDGHTHDSPHDHRGSGTESAPVQAAEREGADSDRGSLPKTPPPVPTDDNAPIFVLLEIDASDQIAVDTKLSNAEICENFAVLQRDAPSFEIEIGSVSPRGPPV